ncbi:MAG: nucleotidyltransferase family protein [Deltaproteobacteria bacterium]|nr:MAG: nucleotidyltransferase family protein [Deltaproteobacteria bacterium]TMQ14803.1 MAG: nucleotidyltransferase family protein [Deltaproteobacteria bacterium]
MAGSRASPIAGEAEFWSGIANAERFFMGNAEVQNALKKLTRTLDAAGIPYAIAGAMALNQYGYRRVTVDVDVLLTRDGLERLKREVLGRGYVEKFPGSKGLRDTEYGVAIDVLLAGDYPGDGKAKPVRFPDPATVAVRGEHGAFLPLETLIELKLASGLSAPHRLKDLADVLELIRAAALPDSLAARLDPSVRAKYVELWTAAQTADDEQDQPPRTSPDRGTK